MCWHSCLPVESSRMEGHASGPGPGSWVSVMILVLEGGKGEWEGCFWFIYLQFADLNSESSTGELKRKWESQRQQRAE